jgi:membrane carboxypeptidase/penicillin-binding protein
MGFEHPAAGKTGTTSHHRDAWFAGYTPQLTTVVWVGLDQSVISEEAKVRLTGATSALPIWVGFMKSALSGQTPVSFPDSPLLEDISIDLHTGKKAKSGCAAEQVAVEKYLRENLPQDQSCEDTWPISDTQKETEVR